MYHYVNVYDHYSSLRLLIIIVAITKNYMCIHSFLKIKNIPLSALSGRNNKYYKLPLHTGIQDTALCPLYQRMRDL